VVAEVVEMILVESRRPLTRGELAKELEARGVRLPAKDKAKYVGTILWRQSERFENDGDGYWLKGQPRPKTDLLRDLRGSVAELEKEKRPTKP
jgi:hypothetical protein